MIVDLPNTTTSTVSKKIMSLREQGGVNFRMRPEAEEQADRGGGCTWND